MSGNVRTPPKEYTPFADLCSSRSSPMRNDRNSTRAIFTASGGNCEKRSIRFVPQSNLPDSIHSVTAGRDAKQMQSGGAFRARPLSIHPPPASAATGYRCGAPPACPPPPPTCPPPLVCPPPPTCPPPPPPTCP